MQHTATMSVAFQFWMYLVGLTLFCFYHSGSRWGRKRGGGNCNKAGQLKLIQKRKLRREENGEGVVCLTEWRKDLNVLAAVDKRRRMGQDDEQCTHLWKQSCDGAMRSTGSGSADQDYKRGGDWGRGIFPEVISFFLLGNLYTLSWGQIHTYTWHVRKSQTRNVL